MYHSLWQTPQTPPMLSSASRLQTVHTKCQVPSLTTLHVSAQQEFASSSKPEVHACTIQQTLGSNSSLFLLAQYDLGVQISCVGRGTSPVRQLVMASPAHCLQQLHCRYIHRTWQLSQPPATCP
jgi:hypothetical protein